MAPKLLKLKVKVMMMAGKVALMIKGKVMRLKLCSAVAPSIEAASYRSFGKVVKTPVINIMKYGAPNHKLTNRITALAKLPFSGMMNQ